ncbi:carboxyl-terminal processing protease [Nonlabens dokdonensis]|uniref:Periplasmic carboxyl-terminal processing protease (Precursor), S41A family n=2 Tax=Nonlabens dokdonensis TaxID=328515 RepID=L7WC86_NONDD|nr:S41 family peptidase [Nonlabens dokdonensis]AGC76518.1 periplasmic carboxyl-terminal processing protease (Precursor), S41A family [Nonlabens dokdonensis DSW-6]PZX44169.1 carboxyl-terminal processing protease [Nonlabens dokdonensis]
MSKKINIKRQILLPIAAAGLLLSTASFQNDFFEIAKQIEIFTEMYKQLNMNYVDDTNPADLMDNAIEGMMEGLDPYTVYWTEQEVEKSKINRRGSYTGIGANVRTFDNKITIIEPWKDYPADKAGLKAGDEIIEIDGVKIADYKENAGDLLQGSEGTELTLKYTRQGKTSTATLKREGVEVKAVPFYEMATPDIGYLVLSKFNEKASRETKAAIKELQEKGAKKVILDLRGNPGGLLSEAVNVSNLFIPKGKLITSTQSVVAKYNKTYLTKRSEEFEGMPVAVLINGRSASASEIVSGSIQDYDRGVIIGARSFGKGLVQRPKPLSYGTQVKITISRYYTPSGRCIQALDYWNRDENGDAVRTKKEDYKAFKTVNSGRTVYDGGGVEPDISLETAAYSPITTALLKENSIFDYATDYYYKHQYNSIDEIQFTDADFQDFVSWIEKRGFEFETVTESAFAKAYQSATNEELDDDIKTSYDTMLEAIKKAKKKEVIDKKAELKSLLTDEIVKRYFYKEGLYNYQIKYNPEIRTAIEVLNDEGKYNRILK